MSTTEQDAERPDIEHDPMWHRAYMDVQKVLDEALGTEEEDGSGGGIASEVWLLAHQRDEARAEAATLAAKLKDLTAPGLFPAAPESTESQPASDDSDLAPATAPAQSGPRTGAVPSLPVAAIPEPWIDAALEADTEWMRRSRPVVFISPSRDQVRAMLEAAEPLIRAAEAERIRELARSWNVTVYVADPEDGKLAGVAVGVPFADLISSDEKGAGHA